jgi:outer membrane usher protein
VTSLNTHTDIDDAVVNVVPTKGALVRAKFNARVGVRALMVLMHNGKPVPFGAMVSIPGNDNSGIVGDDGQAYLSGLPLTGTVKALWGQEAHQQCVAKYSLEEKSLHQAITRMKAECI